MTCLGFGAGLISIYGFFVEPLSQEFGVGVATLNIGPVALLLVPAFVAPMVGKLVDRTPIRRIILIGATLAMLSLLAVSQAPSLLAAALGFLCFALGLTLYGPVVINGLMVKTYPGKEARALAVAAMGISLATVIMPPVVGALLAHLEWRWALARLYRLAGGCGSQFCQMAGGGTAVTANGGYRLIAVGQRCLRGGPGNVPAGVWWWRLYPHASLSQQPLF